MTARLLRIALTLAFALATCCALPFAQHAVAPPRTLALPAPPPPPPPNLLVVMLDDVGFGDFGVYGSTFIPTPEFDRLASEGVRLTSFNTSGAVCSPTRASYLTGRYPPALGFYDALWPGSQRGLSQVETTLAEMLAAVGYRTGHVGKWHLGYPGGAATDEFLPPAAGFESSARLVIGLQPNHFQPQIVVDETTTIHEVGHSTTVLTDYAIAFLDELQSDPRPFFLNLCYFAPHTPLQAPPEFLALFPDQSGASVYGAMLAHVDAEFGRLLAHLELLGLTADTLVVVFSDNGGSQFAGQHPNGNGDLAGFKRDVLEGGIRTPFVARFPGRIPPGIVNDSLVVSLDLVPTLLALLGVELPSGPTGPAELDGHDQSQALLGPNVVPRSERLFWTSRVLGPSFVPPNRIVDQVALREDRASLGGEDWKLVYRPVVGGVQQPTLELFDLDTDPGESVDRGAEFPALVAELWDAYWMHRLAETEIDWIGLPSGAALPLVDSRGELTGYEFAGGAVTLPPQAAFDTHDGDFALRLRVTTSVAATGALQVLATKPGSFALYVTADGHVALELTRQAGGTMTFASTTPLSDGVPCAVGFTLTGWLQSPLDVALSIEGVVESSAPLGGVLAPNREPIVLGNDASGAQPFAGVLAEVHFHRLTLPPSLLVGVPPPMP